jgi:hypothetical protein
VSGPVSMDLRPALEQRLAALRQEQRTTRRCLSDLRARELQALDILLRLDRAAAILEEELDSELTRSTSAGRGA